MKKPQDNPAGKGSSPRPLNGSGDFGYNYTHAFRKKECPCEECRNKDFGYKKNYDNKLK